MLQNAVINGKQVVACHACKTIFGDQPQSDNSLVQMELCPTCGYFYYKQFPDTKCCDLQEVIDEKVNEDG